MLPRAISCLLLLGAVLSHARCNSVFRHESEPRRDPVAAASGLTSRVTSHVARAQDPRLPLPSDVDAFKKLAQILITLGEQVIPAIISEPRVNKCESTLESHDVAAAAPTTTSKPI